MNAWNFLSILNRNGLDVIEPEKNHMCVEVYREMYIEYIGRIIVYAMDFCKCL